MQLVTFGDLALIRPDGSRVAATWRKPLTMLAIVAAHAGPGVSREQLASLLWPDSSPDRGRQTLSQTLYALKQEIGFAPFTGSAVLQLDPRIACDVTAFRRAVQQEDADAALALAPEPFLSGVRIAGSPEFDQWLDRLQREFDTALTACLRTAARRALASGASDTVRRWQLYADRTLLDSPAVREAAEAMATAGNRAAALTLLARHADAMARELELKPDASTLALAERVRQAQIDTPSAGAGVVTPIERWTDLPTGRTARNGDTVVASPMAAAPTRADASISGARTRPRSSARALFAVAAVAVVLIALSFAVPSRRALDAGNVSRVLVSPFRYSGDSTHRYLATGIADEIAARLVQLSGVTLYPPSLVPEASQAAPLPIARRLGAQYLLEGSVRTEARDGRIEVRVVSRLVSAADGHVLWSWSANRQLDGVLGLQMAIADSAARRMSVALNAAALRRLTTLPTKDTEAFDLYLRALEYLRSGRDHLPEARDVLRKAVARDSSFAQALARLGETQARMNWYGYDRDSTQMREAFRLIVSSRALAPDRAEPHLAMAHWLLADRRAYRGATAELDTAMLLGQADVEALMTRANVLRRTGRWTEATADYAEALRLDPTSYAVAIEYGNTLMLMRRFADARVALERARTLSPDAVDPVAWLAALAVRENGDTATARRLLNEAAELVDAHRLASRVLQSFPEVVRAIRGPLFPQVTEFSLRDAYGDSALLHALRGTRARSAVEQRHHIDSAMAVTASRLVPDLNAFAAYRTLASLRLAQNLPMDAVVAARESYRQMPWTRDVYAAMQSLGILAEAEVAAGQLDSAAVHVRQLLGMPSMLSPALLRVDPAWRAVAGRVASGQK